MRVVIIGAGIMGTATALELARRGVRDIVVLERAVPGAEASSAAAGMLAAQMESKNEAERATFAAARNGYAAWAEELRAASGVDVGYRRCGALELAMNDESLEALTTRVASDRAAGLRAEIVDVAGAREIEPELTAKIAGAAWFADEAQVDPPQLLRALVAAVVRAGVVLRSGVTVSSIVEEGGRCVGVEVTGVPDGREAIRADAVILAAGSWSSLVPGVPSTLPLVRPVRGQLLLLEERPPRVSRILASHGTYVVPRGDGRVVCGSTMEDVGHRREVTAAGVQKILAGSIDVAACLGAAELARVWCNFRPHAEGGPQIGPSPLAGLFLATGHHRNGILLAKATADLVADAAVDR